MPRSFSYWIVLQADAAGALLRAAALARLAERMLALVLVLYTLARFQSAPLAGWVAFTAMAPGLVASPFAGALLDRFGAPWAIALDMGCSAGCVLIMGLLAFADADNPALLLTVAGLYSLSSPLSAAGIRTLLPSLVPAGALGPANALDASLYALVEVCGPAIAGILFGFAGAATALFVIALLYAAAGAALPRGQPTPPRCWPGWRAILGDAGAGVAYVLRHRTLRRLAGAYATYQLAWGILLVVVPVAVRESIEFRSSADVVVGVLRAVSGAGAAVGALLIGKRLNARRESTVMALGMAVTAVAVEPVGAWLGLAGLAAGLALLGLLAGPIDVALLTLRQRCTDSGWLGRVMAVSMSCNLSGLPAGAALGGVLLAWWQPAAFAAAALACLLGALLSLRLESS